MKTKEIFKVIVYGLIIFTLASCKKKEETQPEPIDYTVTYLKKSWKLDKYLFNSVDSTLKLLIKIYEETYSDNGVYSRSYLDKKGDPKSESGTWQYEKEQTRLRISGVSSMEITNSSGTVTSSYYNIKKISDTEFWYDFINGSDKHEFRLIKK